MLRRLVLCALALCALAALEGCGVSRVTGPALNTGGNAVRTASGVRKFADDPGSPPRTDDGGSGTLIGGSGAGGGGIEADSLAASVDAGQ